LRARAGPALDVFGQSVQWDSVPAAPVTTRAEDPFDLQWSRLAAGSAMASNPFVAEVQRELRI
uniref:Catalase n=1 Tax=Heligmosomoides polygyrus TaxID=6339 RepID=A0A183GJC5_HELPZ